MTNQEALDKVVAHLMSQTEICKIGRRCQYTDGKGNHCAVGALLPEEVCSGIAGSWCTLIGDAAIIDAALTHLADVDDFLLLDLQGVHDCPRGFLGGARDHDAKIEMLIELKEIAARYWLDWK